MCFVHEAEKLQVWIVVGSTWSQKIHLRTNDRKEVRQQAVRIKPGSETDRTLTNSGVERRTSWRIQTRSVCQPPESNNRWDLTSFCSWRTRRHLHSEVTWSSAATKYGFKQLEGRKWQKKMKMKKIMTVRAKYFTRLQSSSGGGDKLQVLTSSESAESLFYIHSQSSENPYLIFIHSSSSSSSLTSLSSFLIRNQNISS